jgi:peptidoglycan/LPS O-acetylase OafA/YrhL
MYVHLVFQYSRKDQQYNDHQTMIYWFLGTLTLTHLLAFVYTLMFEAPIMGITKIITTGLKSKFEPS